MRPYDPPSAQELKARADRAYLCQEAVQKLMHENPSMSYDQAFSTANTSLPAMPPGPESVTAAILANQGSPESTRKAGAKFAALVQTAVHQRGLPYEVAWRAVQTEEPELYAAMSEGRPGSPQSSKAERELAAKFN